MGAEEITLTVQQIPQHTHALLATGTVGNALNPEGNITAQGTTITIYREAPANTPCGANAVGVTGGSQPHTNFQPYLCLDLIISLFGIFPSQT